MNVTWSCDSALVQYQRNLKWLEGDIIMLTMQCERQPNAYNKERLDLTKKIVEILKHRICSEQNGGEHQYVGGVCKCCGVSYSGKDDYIEHKILTNGRKDFLKTLPTHQRNGT